MFGVVSCAMSKSISINHSFEQISTEEPTEQEFIYFSLLYEEIESAEL